MIPVRDLWRAEYEGRAREKLLREMLETIESYCRTFAQRRRLAVEVQELARAALKDAYS